MRKIHLILFSFLYVFFLLASLPLNAQMGFDLDIKKPEPYENRELRAEKSSKKKFTFPRRLMQGTFTHYNYFFNANTRLNEVIDRAKTAHREDYALLLPFYNYSLEVTSRDKSQLDSVIYKAKTGIVMHDLRNDWIDDLYLLWGASYFLQREFDSAYQMFQFINYAFAEKEKDGYYKFIGSRMDGGNAMSIATKENENLAKRLISDPPSRNNAFLWQARTLIEANNYADAASLIATLRNDPNFPERLHPSLEEVQAYWYYRQSMWDSSATHLVKALGNAQTKQEKARWEYLAAQMFDRSGKIAQAEELYNKAISHTTDPVLDIYARLSLIRINKSGGDDYIDRNIAELLKMARKERYTEYRDAIYYMAAQMELERNNPVAAQQYLLKGSKYNTNQDARNRSFIKLADLSYANGDYPLAASYYDSLQMETISFDEQERIRGRQDILSRLVKPLLTVNRQDSLQRIASLPEEERMDYLKKLARKLRKQQGLKEEENNPTFVARATANDPFRSQTKGEWYFYNETSKQQGLATFKQVWGNRPNVDNWRRSANALPQFGTASGNAAANNTVGFDLSTGVITAEALLNSLPLKEEQLRLSNDSIRNALQTAAKIYLNEIEDYPAAIRTYEELRRRFPELASNSEVLFNLHYAYSKTGDGSKASTLKQQILQNNPGSREAVILSTGKDPQAVGTSPEVTKTYEGIYDLFVEGKFTEAKKAKLIADSLYKTNFWSPQLLYIEAVYHIKQREDSTAMQVLSTLLQQHTNSPIEEKATNLLQVLSRRKEIEDELRNLQIVRPIEEEPVKKEEVVVSVTPVKPETPPAKTDQVKKEEPVVAKKEPEAPPVTTVQQPVVQVEQKPTIQRDTTTLKTEKAAVVKTAPKVVADTLAKKNTATQPKNNSLFTYFPEAPHYAVVILNKVDNVYAEESKSAFNRYSLQTHRGQTINLNVITLDGENKLLLIGPFSNVLQSVDYVQRAKEVAGTQILPWLKPEKYSFTIISENNLEVLKANPDLNKYKTFLEGNTKVKF